MTATPPRLRALHVRRPHGVRGELRCESLGGDASRFTPGMALFGEDGAGYTVASARPVADGDVLLALRQIDTRNKAESLHGAYLCVDREAARTLGDDEWFDFQLVGLRVVSSHDGAALGTVGDVEEYPEQSVLVVRDERGGERRIPLVRAHVDSVDVTGGTITVTPWAEDGD
ncbi:MAG TPA: ribosome maturation factor RimM [Candidatus Dormibacteraeota bacterium]|nr:ribosome maturation factor RimM [Candidatus Dormibacteraeota bacterium]